jgi:phosphopantothenoylcysteine decarboxylase
VVYVVVCAAPPAQHIHELVSLLCSDQRQVIVFATPTAAEWINGSLVRDLTGTPVRSVPRSVD